jgi:hypothetical protein
MKDCFVKTLAGELDNNNLPVYGKIEIKVNSTGTTNAIRIYGIVKLEIVGDGYFVSSDPGEGHWSDGTNSMGKTRTLTGGWADVLVSAGSYKIYIDKYEKSQYFTQITWKNYCQININDFNYIIAGFGSFSNITPNTNTINDVKFNPTNHINTLLSLYISYLYSLLSFFLSSTLKKNAHNTITIKIYKHTNKK